MKKLLFIFGMLSFIILHQCRKDDIFEEEIPTPKQEEKIFIGEIQLSENDPNTFTAYIAQSAVSNSNIDPNGNFDLVSLKNSKFQIFMVNSKRTGETVYYGINDPGTDKVLINDSITAVGLLLINPYLIGSEQEHREQFINNATIQPNFNKLVKTISESRKSSPDNPLDELIHPEIYQLVNDLSLETFEKLGAGGKMVDVKYGEDCIVIKDQAGNNVGFENHRHVFYAVDIKNLSNDKNETLLLSRKDKVFTWVWWPIWKMGPKYVQPPVTSKKIDDGLYSFDFDKLNFEDFEDFESAKTRATSYNMLFGIYYFMDIVVGLGDFNEKVDHKTLARVLQASPEVLEIERSIIEGETGNTINAFLDLIVSEVGTTIIKDYIGFNIKKDFKESTYKSFKKILGVLTALGYLNEHIPFFIDLNRGPHSYDEQYRSINGKLEHIKTQLPPEVKIICKPGIGYGNTEFTFDVEYEDDYTNKENAFYQWKWVANGQDESSVDWGERSHEFSKTFNFNSPGTIYVQVDDLMSDIVKSSKQIPFYKTIDKTRIIVLSAMYGYQYDDYLSDSLNYKNIQFIENENELHHILTHPSQSCDLMGYVFDHKILNPQTDLLVIDPSRNDYFCPPYIKTSDYDNPVLNDYLTHKLAIMNFVNNGGNLLFINSWNVGYDAGSLLVDFLNNGSSFIYSGTESNRKFIPNDNMRIMTSVAFSNIPKNSLIHLTNDNNLPVLLEIKKGQGTILVSAFNSFYNGNGLPGEPMHHPVNINTFKYLIGAEIE